MRQNRFLPAALLAVALVACQQSAPQGDIAIDTGPSDVANAEVESLPPSETADATENAPAVQSPSPTPAAARIPEQYHGRWGMVAADCTSTRGDAKGLITIGDKSIRFYESTATLVEQRLATATGFAGAYHFSGEGQEWDKVVTLKRSGDALTRADDEGNFRYRRC